MNTIFFIKKAKEVHGDKYDYSQSIYSGSHSKIKIICNKHGLFEQQATCHINRKNGCPKCASIIRSNKVSNKIKGRVYKSLNELINISNKIHNNKYDYSLTKYDGINSVSIIICPTHGQFEQSLYSHSRGHGCSKCAILKNTNNINEFIIKATAIHKNKYDYKKTIYNGIKNKLLIECPIHGQFEQLAEKHLSGHGCNKCGHDLSNNKNKSSTKEFILKAVNEHEEKYDYTSSKYCGNNNKIKIICQIHGEFEQTPHNHLKGHGCPKCIGIISKEEDEISELFNGINILRNSRSIIKPYELDIYSPNHKLAIEYNGIYWHSYSYLASTINKFKHYDKHEICAKLGIKLLQITDHEWKNQKEIVKSMILSSIGKSNRIFARKCELIELTNDEFNEFMKRTHFQGKTNTNVKIGLINNGNLVCAMGLNKHNKYEWEISRYSNELNTNVIGGASKILANFIIKNKPKTIMSYANRRYSVGNLYKAIGFKLISVVDPNYFYTKGNKIFSRQTFQKHKLIKLLNNFNDQLSESQNMFNNGFKKYWDAGHYKYLLTL